MNGVLTRCGEETRFRIEISNKQRLSMTTMLRIAVLGSFVCALGRAETWTGWLVSANCYQSEENNVNPGDPLTNVDRDRGEEVMYCSPNAKTKSFTIVDRDGYTHRLDMNGNTQAADLVRTAGKKNYYAVTVTGEKEKNAIKVQSIMLDHR